MLVAYVLLKVTCKQKAEHNGPNAGFVRALRIPGGNQLYARCVRVTVVVRFVDVVGIRSQSGEASFARQNYLRTAIM